MKNRFLTVFAMMIAVCLIFASFGYSGAGAADSLIAENVLRIAGENRFQTSAFASMTGWSRADNVVIASADSYADALAGVPLAYALDAPILLVRGGSIDEDVFRSIRTLSPKKAYILGGRAAVSAEVERQLALYMYGYEESGETYVSDDALVGDRIERIYGYDRVETGILIARALESVKGRPYRVFAVCPDNYPDALACGSIAAMTASPVLYVDESSGGARFLSYVAESGCSAVTISGGTAAVSSAAENRLRETGSVSVERIAGRDRYQTALEIVKRYNDYFWGTDVMLSTGDSFPDALSGGVLAAKLGCPLVLVNNYSSVDGLYGYLSRRQIKNMYILGGAAAVSDYAVECIRNNTPITTTRPPETFKTTVSAGKVGKNNPNVVSPNYNSQYYLVVFEGSQSVCVYGKDRNGRYSVLVRSMKCSSGAKATPTPKGVFSVQAKYRWRLMNGDVYAQYASRFYNNVLFHSVLYRERNAATLYEQSYKNLGRRASHGCVRLSVRDAKWIYDNVPFGTQVRVTAGSGPAGASLPSLRSGSKYRGWEPTDPLSRNPYRK